MNRVIRSHGLLQHPGLIIQLGHEPAYRELTTDIKPLWQLQACFFHAGNNPDGSRSVKTGRASQAVAREVKIVDKPFGPDNLGR
jgi:hypothetical protein